MPRKRSDYDQIVLHCERPCKQKMTLQIYAKLCLAWVVIHSTIQMSATVAAFGLAVNIITLVEISFTTIARIQQYAGAADIPQALRHTLKCLSAIAGRLQQLKQQNLASTNSQEDNIKQVLIEFITLVGTLEADIKKVVPMENRSSACLGSLATQHVCLMSCGRNAWSVTG